jgi:hypothetical protein
MGCAPDRDRRRGRLETEVMCESSRSSSTDRDDDRVRARERVYRVRSEPRDREGWNVDSVGDAPSRIKLPMMCVCL